MMAALGALASAGAGCDPALPPPEALDLPKGPCGRGAYVVLSDYQSTAITIANWEGELVSAPYLSSGSSESGLSVALSGDVVAPTEKTDGKLILIDRYPASVVTVVDVLLGSIDTQINVQTGFASNPQDALLDGSALWITRYETNPNPGKEPFDEGGDVLIVEGGAVRDRIGFEGVLSEPELFPRPSRIAKSGRRAWVLLSAYSSDFATSGDGALVEIDLDARTLGAVTPLPGSRGCGGLARNGDQLLVSCSGSFAGGGNPSSADSALVVFDIEEDGLALRRRFSAEDLGGEPLGFSVGALSASRWVVGTLGELGESGAQKTPDRLVVVDESGAFDVLRETASEPFSFGEIRCEAACGCLVTDAESMSLLHVTAEGIERFDVESGLELPPRSLGLL